MLGHIFEDSPLKDESQGNKKGKKSKSDKLLPSLSFLPFLLPLLKSSD
jgi:hypothetical protein